MVDIDKIEKTMEKYHNIFYRPACIMVFIIFMDVVGIGIVAWANYRTELIAQNYHWFAMLTYDFMAFVGGPLVLAFMVYTIGFTKFSFPFRFRGSGGGRKIRPPFTRQ